MATRAHQLPDDDSSDHEREARAARVATMLERWSQEDVSHEPDWDIREVEPLRLRAPPKTASATRKRRSPA